MELLNAPNVMENFNIWMELNERDPKTSQQVLTKQIRKSNDTRFVCSSDVTIHLKVNYQWQRFHIRINLLLYELLIFVSFS